MKKAIMPVVLSLVLVLALGAVAAQTEGDGGTTIIAGKIYNSDFTLEIQGATVEVTCDDLTKTKTSEADGAYSVEYDEEDCSEGSDLSVHAYKAGVGENTVSGVIYDNYPVPSWNLNLGVVNVPLVPEFGLLVGTLTILGAVGVFFVVRRR